MSNKKDSSIKEIIKNTGIDGAIDGVGEARTDDSLKLLTEATLSKIGFTNAGIGLKTIAAGLQSSIGKVVAGTPFAYSQSIGSTHFILPNQFNILIIIIVGIVSAGYALIRSIKKHR